MVEQSSYPDNMPLYRLLAAEENLTEIEARPLESNILLSGGFVFGDEPFYDVGFRYREQVRRYRGIRIELLGSQRLHDDRVVRLSWSGAIRERLSSEFYGPFSIPAYETIDIRLLINTEDRGYYVDAGRIDDGFLERNFPSDSGGNLVRVRGRGVGFTLVEGTATEAVEHIWDETLWRYDDPAYPELLRAEIDIEQWIKWLAVTAVIGDYDTVMAPHLENHLEYERPSDGRIVLFSNDMDCTRNCPRVSIEEGTTRAAIDPRFQSFLRYPPFRRQYYQEITDILDTEFLPDKLYPIIDDLCAKTGQTAWTTSKLREYVSIRRAYLEEAIENYIALSDSFMPSIETRRGNDLFTEGANVTISGSVVPQSAEVEVFRVEGSPVELITDGGFEGGADGWVINNSVAGISVGVDTSVSHKGNASMRVEMLGGDPGYHHTTQIIDCEPPTQYKVSYYIKAVGMVSGNMYLNIVDADNGEDYLSVDVPQQRDNGPWVYTMANCDWTQRCGVFKTKEESCRLAIRIARIEVRYQTVDTEAPCVTTIFASRKSTTDTSRWGLVPMTGRPVDGASSFNWRRGETCLVSSPGGWSRAHIWGWPDSFVFTKVTTRITTSFPIAGRWNGLGLLGRGPTATPTTIWWRTRQNFSIA